MTKAKINEYIKQKQQYQNNLDSYISEFENLINQQSLAKKTLQAKQKFLLPAINAFVKNRDVTLLNRIIKADQELSDLINSDLPHSTNFFEFKKIEDSNEIIPIGINGDGKQIAGQPFDPMAILPLLEN